MQVRIRKGLDVPLAGPPRQVVSEAPAVGTVALLGTDVHGLRPRLLVDAGERVRLGQPLFIDKRNPDVPFTAPGAGTVSAINRGDKRALLSVVIDLDGDAAESFPVHDASRLSALERPAVREIIVRAGLWPSFRTRPFSRVPAPAAAPAALFVTAIDTNPLAADPAVVIAGSAEAFAAGLAVVGRVADVPVYVCTAPGAGIACPEGGPFRHAEFAGPHPAGLPGTHIHFLLPVGERRSVWHVGYQDVIAMGELFLAGRPPTRRVVALGGPAVRDPRLLATRRGAAVTELLAGETLAGRKRVISGSALGGHRASGPLAWLGRYHNQVTVLAEGSEREFLAFMRPGLDKYSATRSYAAHLGRRHGFALSTSQNGSPRAMVPTGAFERVMPLDILPTPLLKALIVEDTERARALGCLELDEEDLALCSFVCNGKYEYGSFLRMNLDDIEANG